MVWLPFFTFPKKMGMSSSQLTFIFFRGVALAHQPVGIANGEPWLVSIFRMNSPYVTILLRVCSQIDRIVTHCNQGENPFLFIHLQDLRAIADRLSFWMAHIYIHLQLLSAIVDRAIWEFPESHHHHHHHHHHPF